MAYRKSKVKKIMDDFLKKFASWPGYAEYKNKIEANLKGAVSDEERALIEGYSGGFLSLVKSCDDLEKEYQTEKEQYGVDKDFEKEYLKYREKIDKRPYLELY